MSLDADSRALVQNGGTSPILDLTLKVYKYVIVTLYNC